MKNYYEILEVSKNASPEVIEKAYKTLAKKYHPDVCEENDKEKSEKLFKEIGEAYDILSNAEKRADYDSNYEKFVASSSSTSNKTNINQDADDVFRSATYRPQQSAQTRKFR